MQAIARDLHRLLRQRPTSIVSWQRSFPSTYRFYQFREMGHGCDDGEAMQSSGSSPDTGALPKLSSADFRTYNNMAEHMEYFVSITVRDGKTTF